MKSFFERVGVGFETTMAARAMISIVTAMTADNIFISEEIFIPILYQKKKEIVIDIRPDSFHLLR
jgi:hypothetical protein